MFAKVATGSETSVSFATGWVGKSGVIVSYRGASLIPGFGGNRPVLAEPEGVSEVSRR